MIGHCAKVDAVVNVCENDGFFEMLIVLVVGKVVQLLLSTLSDTNKMHNSFVVGYNKKDEELQCSGRPQGSMSSSAGPSLRGRCNQCIAAAEVHRRFVSAAPKHRLSDGFVGGSAEFVGKSDCNTNVLH